MLNWFKKQDIVAVTIIGEGTILDGNIITDGDLFIKGNVTSKTIRARNIVIEKEGTVMGDIQCGSIGIEGVYKGHIICDNITIGSTGNVTSEITYAGSIIIDGSSSFNGTVKNTPKAKDLE